jgi:hypothetical protein
VARLQNNEFEVTAPAASARRAWAWLSPAICWALLAFALNLIWELAQLPLYTLADRPAGEIAYGIVHCTLGDGLIAFCGYLLVSLLLRSPDWPTKRPWAGIGLFSVLSVAFTAWSEWYNVYRTGSWAYAASMPTILGIGLSPLVQWIAVPGAMLALWRLRAPE